MDRRFLELKYIVTERTETPSHVVVTLEPVDTTVIDLGKLTLTGRGLYFIGPLEGMRPEWNDKSRGTRVTVTLTVQEP